ncbi:MAG: IreB family regulatory phosphoprotein [Clostridia bacterium]|nr:IreB family regulatory phosphoprotein [Clostridia bacterium]MBR3932411.1 IreB family regulatory phosphoprotein [Clostridia bacterium]
MEKSESAKIFDEIVSALTEAGYEPLMQINGYLETGNITYITRKNNAREKILLLSHTDLENYIAKLK